VPDRLELVRQGVDVERLDEDPLEPEGDQVLRASGPVVGGGGQEDRPLHSGGFPERRKETGGRRVIVHVQQNDLRPGLLGELAA
jgi:hypothetical protein